MHLPNTTKLRVEFAGRSPRRLINSFFVHPDLPSPQRQKWRDGEWQSAVVGCMWAIAKWASIKGPEPLPDLPADEGPACSALDALYQPVQWTTKMFGPNARAVLRKRQSDKRRYLRTSLRPCEIEVQINGIPVEDGSALESLASDLQKQWQQRHNKPDEGCAPFSDGHTIQRSDPDEAARLLVQTLMTANAEACFGVELPLPWSGTVSEFQAEGVIFTKPGVGLNEGALREIVKRIAFYCHIRQVRLFDGDTVKGKGLFEKQLRGPTRLAAARKPLDGHEMQLVSQLYDVPQFKTKFGVSYTGNLVIGGLHLVQKEAVTEADLTKLWNQGRGEYFHSETIDGINKICYQKSVFAVKLPGGSVHVVVNGYLPGYKALMEEPNNRVVALDVASHVPWQIIRDQVVGGSSNPKNCAPGTIRHDAWRGRIEGLATKDVDGQKNVCHCSAGQIDGALELGVWFDRNWTATHVGRGLTELGVTEKEIATVVDGNLARLSESTRKDETLNKLLFEMFGDRVRSELHSTAARQCRDKLLGDIASAIHASKADAKANTEVANAVENGVRFQIAGPSFFTEQIRTTFGDSETRELFDDVAESIVEIADKSGDEVITACVTAEALRIAASDLKLLACTPSARLPRLLKARLGVELPKQAWDCGVRTLGNLEKHFRQPTDVGSTQLTKSDAWSEFIASARSEPPQIGDVLGLILCGGRSTRMATTIPKPLLPLGSKLLVEHACDTLKRAGVTALYAGVGFRADVVTAGLKGIDISPLVYDKTPGLGFRVAVCLEILKAWKGPVVLTYCDMPLLDPMRIKQLINLVKDHAEQKSRGNGSRKVLGLLTTHQSSSLSGVIERAERNGPVRRVIQSRMDHDRRWEYHDRDVGVYVFYNTPEFRAALGQIVDDNPRREYIFADVVAELAKAKWKVVELSESPERALGINTAGDLLHAAALPIEVNPRFSTLQICNQLRDSFQLECTHHGSPQEFLTALKAYRGPLYLYQWWDNAWS